jgi:Rrf2 family protein
MHVSKKSYYGLRAVVAVAEKGEMSAHDIAVTENLPEDYLEKILQALSRSGILVSEKGVSGGYTLPRPECVTALDVFTALEGTFRAFPAPPLTKADPFPKLTHCRTNLVWKTLEREIRETLSRVTIATLISPDTK